MQTQGDRKQAAFQIHWHWLIPSFGVLLFYRSFYIYPFAVLLRGLSRKDVPSRETFILFHLANITRYLPGRIWGVVRLLSFSRQFGLSKTATASSLILHVGIETGLGGLIAMSLLFSKQMQDTARGTLEKMSGHTLLLFFAVMGILAGLVFLIPKLAHHARAFLKTFLPLLKDTRLWGNILVVHSVLWLCQGLAFFLFVRSLASVRWADAGVLTNPTPVARKPPRHAAALHYTSLHFTPVLPRHAFPPRPTFTRFLASTPRYLHRTPPATFEESPRPAPKRR